MPDRFAICEWEGDLLAGEGVVSTASGALQHALVTFATRFQNAPGTNPEELIAAAHATCFNMALAEALAERKLRPRKLTTRATVSIVREEAGWRITRSHLQVEGQVPDLESTIFTDIARTAKERCPVSKALHGNVEITLEAALETMPMPS